MHLRRKDLDINKVIAIFFLCFACFLTQNLFATSNLPSRTLCLYALSGPPNLDNWPQIQWNDVKDLRDVSNEVRGLGFMKAFVGNYQEKQVFLKVSSVTQQLGASLSRSIDNVRNEAYWFNLLAEKGWAPHLHGISFFLSDSGRAHYVLVTDYIEGIATSASKIEYRQDLPENFFTTPRALFELERFFAFMEENEIFPHDIQIILRPDGSWRVVDLEWYLPISKLDSGKLKDFESYEKKKQIILEYFERHLIR